MQGRIHTHLRGRQRAIHRAPASRRLGIGTIQARRRALRCESTNLPEAAAALSPHASDKSQCRDGLLDGFCPEPGVEAQLALTSNGRLLLLRLADVEWLHAIDNTVCVRIGSESHLLVETLEAVEAKLPPGLFLRISRHVLVNVRQIKQWRQLCTGECQILLRNGTRLVAMAQKGPLAQ